MRQAEGPHAGEDSRREVVPVGALRYADMVEIIRAPAVTPGGGGTSR